MFELAHEDRVVILKELSERKMKLTQLSNRLGLPVQEVHRQLARLIEERLIMKNSWVLFPNFIRRVRP